MPLGATVLYGEYGQYNDQFNNLAGVNQCLRRRRFPGRLLVTSAAD